MEGETRGGRGGGRFGIKVGGRSVREKVIRISMYY